MNLVNQVLDFVVISDEPCKAGPKPLSAREWIKSHSILEKSLNTISDACWSKKEIEHATLAISNSIYTLATLACEMGVHDYLNECIDEIHKVRMSGEENGANEQSLEAIKAILSKKK